MLNISQNKITDRIDTSLYKSFALLKNYKSGKVFSRLLGISLLIVVLILFVPWTQNIRSRGFITTLSPDQRPQTINSIIAGRIEKWYVKEGDYVNKGDTVAFISEMKDKFFDPELISRTESQIKSKKFSVSSYMNKVKSLEAQIDAMIQTKILKIEQANNHYLQAKLKIKSDSIDLEAAKTNLRIAEKQVLRTDKLYEGGLKSLTDLETKKLKLQETQAKKISAENKLLGSRNQLINIEVEFSSIENQYQNKISKAESEKYASLSNMYDAEIAVTKMQNQYANYTVRKGFNYITSPQNGLITKAIRSGIGETIKEGEKLVSIMPANYDLAVYMYIEPIDIPLINKEQHIRFIFDGWPTIVFSGWPDMSFGTFGGEVVAIDNFISQNGNYRILVAPDKNDVEWPKELRIGAGANGFVLLKEVPIWYEMWRKLNGFPPDYYQVDLKIKEESKFN